ncbi:alpha/beta fold hydrolase [Microbaculum marinum]|uniref:Alpha/beta fold hydrolase n=1 Tax=Microbaculum marinum TaxID=1764581 RepID=A0AAW9S267_9HYPH
MEIAGRPVVHLDTGGDGPVLVLCHALALDHRMWAETARILAPRFRVIAPDLMGHGQDEVTVPKDIGELADDVGMLLDARNVDRFHLAGISMGGAVAQHLAIRAEDRVAGLALMATMPRGGPVFEDRAVAAETDGIAAQVAGTLARWFTAAEIAADLPGVRYARTQLRCTPVARWASAWRALARHDATEGLRSLRCSVTCIGVSEDTSCPPAVIEALQASIPGAGLRMLQGASHLFPLTRAQETAGLLADAFAQS